MYDHIIMQLQLSLEALKYKNSEDDYGYDDVSGEIYDYPRMKSVEGAIENISHAISFLQECGE